LSVAEILQTEEKNVRVMKKEECFHKNLIDDEELKNKTQKQQIIFSQQQRDIQVRLLVISSPLFSFLD
jgi:kinesin family protein C2/C3